MLIVNLTSASTAAAVTLQNDTHVISLYDHLEIFEDSGGELSIGDIASGNHTFSDVDIRSSLPKLGLSTSAFWLKTSIISQAPQSKEWYILLIGNASRSLEAYVQLDGESSHTQLKLYIQSRGAVFEFAPLLGQRYTLYLRAQDKHAPLGFKFELISSKAFLRQATAEYPVYGLIIGGLFTLAIYNLFYFFYLRDFDFLFLSIFITAFTLEMLGHMGWFYYVQTIGYYFKPLGSMFAFIAMACASKVIIQLFSLKNHIKFIFNGFKVLIWVNVFLAFISPFIPYSLAVACTSGIALSMLTATLLISGFYKKPDCTAASAIAVALFMLSSIPPLLTGAGLILNYSYVNDFSALVLLASLILLSLNQAEATRQKSKQAERVLASSEAKDEFLTTMSHELRTPMNAVVGAGNLLDLTPLSFDQQEYVTRLNASSQHMLLLINDILDIARIDNNALALERQPFDLNDILQSLKLLLIQDCQKKQLKLVLTNHFIPFDKQLIGDPTRLRQVLLNLLHNSTKFTERGGIELVITPTAVTANSASLTFEVSDTGIGIPLEQHAELFNPFTQSESGTSRKYGGSGLGLAISNKLVKQMGGQLEIESELGKGSKFSFSVELPLVPAVKVAPTPKPAYKEQQLAELSVLLVDDDEVNRFFGERLLQTFGVDVTLAESGQVALEHVHSKVFDVVLMDVSMPEMNGYETTQRIRQNKNFDSLPIIALTAHAIVGEKERCLAAGMNDYLSKPFELNQLKATIARWGYASLSQHN